VRQLPPVDEYTFVVRSADYYKTYTMFAVVKYVSVRAALLEVWDLNLWWPGGGVVLLSKQVFFWVFVIYLYLHICFITKV